MGGKDRPSSVASPSPESVRQRLDKWLWHVRLQPTRSRAAEFVKLGFARINGVRTDDPAKTVKPGDVLTLALQNRTLVIRVRAILPRRGSPEIAAAGWEPVSPE